MGRLEVLFSLLDKAELLRPFTVDGIEGLFRLWLPVTPAGFNAFFEIRAAQNADARSPVASVELRLPRLAGHDGLLAIGLHPDPTPAQPMVRLRYGEPKDVFIDRPGGPLAVYWTYRRPRGELRFAFKPDESLASIVLDALRS